MYVWVKKGKVQEAIAFNKSLIPPGGFYGALVLKQLKGRHAFTLNADPFDPTDVRPEIPEELIEAVTWRTSTYGKRKPEGLYHSFGVTLYVRTVPEAHGVLLRQTVHVLGPTVKLVKQIFSLFMRDMLMPIPEYNWG